MPDITAGTELDQATQPGQGEQPPGHHIAELNIGRLVAPVGDPRVSAFISALNRVNGIGKRSPGFVWMMENTEDPTRGNTDVKLDGDPRFVSNLTVWENVPALEEFVWNTVHRQFYERRAEWFEVLGAMHFVMWWVPAGHRPTVEEGRARLHHRERHGDSDHAFGWAYLKQARLWRRHVPAAAVTERDE